MDNSWFHLAKHRKLQTLRELLRVPYLRLDSMFHLKSVKRDPDSIMRYLDRWVTKRGAIGYVPENQVPPKIPVPHRNGIQQVRREISEFIKIVLDNGLGGTVLEIGLGYYGGTHMVWRHIFDRVITIDNSYGLITKFKLTEWLDSRSTLLCGDSKDPQTLEKVRTISPYVDMLFIDGDHTYEGVAADWSLYHRLVRPGGLIAFHDSVCRVESFGVARFLDDLCKGTVDGKPHTLHNIIYSDHVGISYEEC